MPHTPQSEHLVLCSVNNCDIVRITTPDGDRRWCIAPHDAKGVGRVIVGFSRSKTAKLTDVLGPFNTNKKSEQWARAREAWIQFQNRP